MKLDTKLLSRLVTLNNEMKTAFGKDNLTENIEQAKKVLNYYHLFCGFVQDEGEREIYLPLPSTTSSTIVPGYCFAYRTNVNRIVVEYGYDTIGSRAFYYCDDNLTVKLPNSIKTVPTGTQSPFVSVINLNLELDDGFSPSKLDFQYQESWGDSQVSNLVDKLEDLGPIDPETLNTGRPIVLSKNTYSLLSDETIVKANNKGWAVSSV